MLRLVDISLKLGNFSLRNISFDVKRGEYVVLLGPTGTGKTVLLETIAGLYHPDSGNIYLKDLDVTRFPPETRHLGVVYQDYALFPHLTVHANIAFGLKLMGRTDRDVRNAVSEMAHFLDIDHILDRRPRLLSGGERQRVALARALILKPYMLLLDEPLSALDRLTRDRLRRELKRIHGEIGVSILHITHDLSEAFFLADRLIIMKDGAVIQEGNPEETLRHPGNRFVAELLGIENFIPAKIGPGGQVFLEGLGTSDPPLFSSEPGEKVKKIYLTIPGWAIDLFPAKDNGAYLSQVNMRVVGLNHTEAYMEIELEHERGARLSTTLSWREVTMLPTPVESGKIIKVGLLKEGTYWVPGD